MLCAISLRQEKNKHGEDIDVLEQRYIHYFEKFGLKLLLIPNGHDVDYYFEKFPIERVVLSGGNDVDPQMYGGKREEGMSIVSERDITERRIVELAVKKKIPLLGICRGMEFLNIYFGGKLINIKNEYGKEAHLPGKEHPLHILDGQELLRKEVRVNSFHNQALTEKELSSNLQAFAVSDEGIIEGFNHSSLPLVGVQWHPERESPDEEFNAQLVKAFVEGKLWWKR